MTTKNERANALINTRNFLRRMLSPYNGGIKKIPSEVRRECRYLLKHWPHTYELIKALKPKNEIICLDTLEKLHKQEVAEWIKNWKDK